MPSTQWLGAVRCSAVRAFHPMARCGAVRFGRLPPNGWCGPVAVRDFHPMTRLVQCGAVQSTPSTQWLGAVVARCSAVRAFHPMLGAVRCVHG